jgi:hypothetical protein
MRPFLPLRHRLASPLLFLGVVGGAIAVIDYWMRRQLPQTLTGRPNPGAPRSRRVATPRPRRRRLTEDHLKGNGVKTGMATHPASRSRRATLSGRPRRRRHVGELASRTAAGKRLPPGHRCCRSGLMPPGCSLWVNAWNSCLCRRLDETGCSTILAGQRRYQGATLYWCSIGPVLVLYWSSTDGGFWLRARGPRPGRKRWRRTSPPGSPTRSSAATPG